MPVSDLFSHSSNDELLALTDDDLIVASLCVQPSEDEDEFDDAAWRFAVILSLAKSPSTTQAVLKRAFEVVPMWPLYSALACHGGLYDPLAKDNPYPDARHEEHATAMAVTRSNSGDLVANAAASLLVNRARTAHGAKRGSIQFADVFEMTALEEALRVLSDPELLLYVMKHGTTLHSDIAATRLTELDDVDALRDALKVAPYAGVLEPYSARNRIQRAIECLETR